MDEEQNNLWLEEESEEKTAEALRTLPESFCRQPSQ